MHHDYRYCPKSLHPNPSQPNPTLCSTGSPRIMMLERALSTAVVSSFFSTMRAMFNDTLDREQLVVAGGPATCMVNHCWRNHRHGGQLSQLLHVSGAISIYAGLGLLVGPYIEVTLTIMPTLTLTLTFICTVILAVAVIFCLPLSSSFAQGFYFTDAGCEGEFCGEICHRCCCRRHSISVCQGNSALTLNLSPDPNPNPRRHCQ